MQPYDAGTTPSPTESGPPASKRDQGRQALIAGLVLLVVLFALLNVDKVKVNFIVTSAKAPLIVVIAICLAIGIVLGIAAGHRTGKAGKGK